MGEERGKKLNRQRELLFEGGYTNFSFICQRDKEHFSLRVGEERGKKSNRQRELLFEGGDKFFFYLSTRQGALLVEGGGGEKEKVK